MTQEELELLTKEGEGYTLEFKESLTKRIIPEVVAFANSIGGKILIIRKVQNLETNTYLLLDLNCPMNKYALFNEDIKKIIHI